jgi:hypothetical protein
VHEEVVDGTLEETLGLEERARSTQLRHGVRSVLHLSAQIDTVIHIAIAEAALATIAHPCAGGCARRHVPNNSRLDLEQTWRVCIERAEQPALGSWAARRARQTSREVGRGARSALAQKQLGAQQVLAAQASRADAEDSAVVDCEDLTFADRPQSSMDEGSPARDMKHAVRRDALVRKLASNNKQTKRLPQPLCEGVRVEVNDLLQTTQLCLADFGGCDEI